MEKYLTPKQRQDIKNSLYTIIKELEAYLKKEPTDNELLSAYMFLKSKSDFGYNFIKLAKQYCEIERDKGKTDFKG
jgi:hypothetical protein